MMSLAEVHSGEFAAILEAELDDASEEEVAEEEESSSDEDDDDIRNLERYLI